MNFSNLFLKTESDPANHHGAVIPVFYERRTNLLSNIEVGLSMIEKAYELSTPYTSQPPTGSIEPVIVNSNLNELLTETNKERREKVSPVVAQVATMAPVSLQEAKLAEARAAAATALELEATEPAA